MGIMDRLGRLARANVNALLNRARSSSAPSTDLGSFSELELEAELERRRQKRHASESANWERAASDQDPALAGYYRLLELPYGADLNAVRHAYRRLLSKYHPDRHASDPEKQRMANELTQALNHAFDQLEAALTKGQPPK